MFENDWDQLESRQILHVVRAFGQDVRVGDQVRVLPKQNADILDIALQGRIAIVEAIEQDYEDQIHLALVMEDDPGRDLGMMRQPGHRFFFSLDEVEPIQRPGEQDQP